jgi:hypothetical protein
MEVTDAMVERALVKATEEAFLPYREDVDAEDWAKECAMVAAKNRAWMRAVLEAALGESA